MFYCGPMKIEKLNKCNMSNGGIALEVFFLENHNFHIFAPIMLVCKVVFLVIELSGNTMHDFIC